MEKKIRSPIKAPKKRFRSLETVFDLAFTNAEQQFSGDRLRTVKAEKEDVAFLHDRSNAGKMLNVQFGS